MKRLTVCVVVIMLIAAAASLPFVFNAGFGQAPQGAQLSQVEQSPHYRDGQFHNQVPTPGYTGNKGMLAAWWEFLVAKRENARPAQPLPLVATDLASLSPQQDTLVWLGHSSWYLQLAGQRILIDPVLSNYAAPFSFLNKAFAGEYPWTAQTMPEIDLLIISHDHYDHLDLATIKALMPKIKRVITPLGVGSHLRYWGMNSEIIEERDWNQSVKVTDSLIVHVLPAIFLAGGLNVTKRCGPVSCLKRRNRTFTTAATLATGRILKRLASSLARSIWQSWKMASMTRTGSSFI